MIPQGRRQPPPLVQAQPPERVGAHGKRKGGFDREKVLAAVGLYALLLALVRWCRPRRAGSGLRADVLTFMYFQVFSSVV